MTRLESFVAQLITYFANLRRNINNAWQMAVTIEQSATSPIPIAGAVVSTPVAYVSGSDFTATYTSASTITLTGLPFTITGAQQISYIKVLNTATNVTTTYTASPTGYSFGYSSGVITVYLNGVAASVFTTNDVYEIGINAQQKAYDPTLDINKTIDQSPLNSKYVPDTLNSTPNLAIGTTYFPSATGMSMDGYKHLSLTGQLIDAATITLTVEVSNDPAFANPVKIYGYDSQNNVMVNQIATTSSVFSIDFDYLNYTYFRVKVVAGTNLANTATILARRIY